MNSGTWECWQMPNFRGNEDLHKLCKEYLNASLYKFVVYSLQHSETLDISHVFLPLTNAELSTVKQVWFFWLTLYVHLRLYSKSPISWITSHVHRLATTLTTMIISLGAIRVPMQNSILLHTTALAHCISTTDTWMDRRSDHATVAIASSTDMSVSESTLWLHQADNCRQPDFPNCWPTTCQMMWYLLNCCPPSISISKLTSSPNPFSDYFLNCTLTNLSLSGPSSSSLYYLGPFENSASIVWLKWSNVTKKTL